MKRATNSMFGKKYELLRACTACHELPHKGKSCGCGRTLHPLATLTRNTAADIEAGGHYEAQYAHASGYHD